MAIDYRTVTSLEEVAQILDLQAHNLSTAITPETALTQGFLTVRHDLDILWRMNQVEPSIIAKFENKVIGYALVMLPGFAHDIPVLQPMFDLIDQLAIADINQGKQANWFVMGQVCVDEKFRGMGVFDGLYQKMTEVYRNKFDFAITEVAARNTRSLRAHQRVGFKDIHQYSETITGETWHLIMLHFKH